MYIQTYINMDNGKIQLKVQQLAIYILIYIYIYILVQFNCMAGLCTMLPISTLVRADSSAISISPPFLLPPITIIDFLLYQHLS